MSDPSHSTVDAKPWWLAACERSPFPTASKTTVIGPRSWKRPLWGGPGEKRLCKLTRLDRRQWPPCRRASRRRWGSRAAGSPGWTGPASRPQPSPSPQSSSLRKVNKDVWVPRGEPSQRSTQWEGLLCSPVEAERQAKPQQGFPNVPSELNQKRAVSSHGTPEWQRCVWNTMSRKSTGKTWCVKSFFGLFFFLIFMYLFGCPRS